MKHIKTLTALLLLAAVLVLGGCAAPTMDMKASSLGELKTFSAQTLDGKTLTQKDLAAKDLTVLHFWTTQCGPCVEEMPELAKFAHALPDRVQFATVCLMSDGQEEEIRKILKKAGYTGTTLLSGDGDFKKVCDKVQATPTTVMVTNDGRLIGDIVLGSQDDLEKTLLSSVNNALKETGKAEIALDDR